MGQLTKKDMVQRIPSGIPGLDDLLEGGFPKESITLVSGTPGTGKTIVCFQFIQAGLDAGETCLYLTSDERTENLLRQSSELGFDFQSAVDQKQLKIMYLNLEKQTVHREIEEEISTGAYTRVVLDSLTPLSEVPVWVVSKGAEIIPSENSFSTNAYPLDSVQAMRVHIRRIMSILTANHSTSLVTSEVPEGTRQLSRDSVSEFLSDGILFLDLDTSMDRRKLTIRKMRATHHTLKPQDITIQDDGIRIL